MKSARLQSEPEEVFEARMRAEDEEAMAVPCPLRDACGAEVGEKCCTASGQRRPRHVARLMQARKASGNV